MTVWTGENINVSKDAAETESVLILKIASATPLAYVNPNRICAGAYKFAYIKLRHEAASLRKPNISSVNIYLRLRGNAFKNKVCFKTPVSHLKAALVNPDRVNVRNIRRVTGKRIVDICIVWLAVTLKLPTGWNGNITPLGYFPDSVAVFKINEPPFAVKRTNFAALRNVPASWP